MKNKILKKRKNKILSSKAILNTGINFFLFCAITILWGCSKEDSFLKKSPLKSIGASNSSVSGSSPINIVTADVVNGVTVHAPGESDITMVNGSVLFAAWDELFGYINTNPNGDNAPARLMGKTSSNNGVTWSHSFRLFNPQAWEKTCPFLTLGSIIYYRPVSGGDELIFFNSTGNKYAIFNNTNNSWSGPYNITQMGGGGCPFSVIGAATYYRPLNGGTQLFLFNSAGTQYVVYSEYAGEPTWQGPFNISQMAGGGLTFSSVGAATYYQSLNGGNQLLFFNQTGTQYMLYSEYIPNQPTWQGPYSLSTNTGTTGVLGGGCPFMAIGTAFNYQNQIFAYDDIKEQYSVFSISNKTWEIVENNYCPNFLRLANTSLGLFYLNKNVTGSYSNVYFSDLTNETSLTWGPQTNITNQTSMYMVLENCRVTRLTAGSNSGMILIPVENNSGNGEAFCYYSNTSGNWTSSPSMSNSVSLPNGVTSEEPGVVQLSNGNVLMWIRPGNNLQNYPSMSYVYTSNSTNGTAYSSPATATNATSPRAPAVIKLLPSGNLIMAWNNTVFSPSLNGYATLPRNPLTVAISKDNGNTWVNDANIVSSSNTSYQYSYPSIFISNSTAYMTYDTKTDTSYLSFTNFPTSSVDH